MTQYKLTTPDGNMILVFNNQWTYPEQQTQDVMYAMKKYNASECVKLN